MKTQGKVEQEINLIELFWDILFAWRQIICFGIIMAILVSGIKYVLDSRSYHIAQKLETEPEEIELTVEEEENLEEARTLVGRIEEYEEYLSQSALMQIDPYEKPVVELQYYVESDYTYNYTKDNQSDYTGNIMVLYCNYVKSGEMSDKVIKAAKLPISQADFSELCTVSQVGATMSISVVWSEMDKLDLISDFIKEELRQKESEFQEVGSHKLKLLRESKNVIADTDLAEKKNTFANNIVYMNTQLNALKVNMSEQQLELLHSENGLDSDDSEIELIKPGFNKKYAFLGVFLGIFMVCVLLAIKRLFAVKLQTPEEIRTFYNMRILGEIAVQPEKKLFLSCIDDKLLAIKNRRKKKLSLEQQIKVTAANIVLSCKKQGIGHIYITGSEYETADRKILAMLKQELSAQNIRLNEGENIFYDAESLKRGMEVGNILFIERKGQSIYDEIFNELNLAKEQNSNILGVVVLV